MLVESILNLDEWKLVRINLVYLLSRFYNFRCHRRQYDEYMSILKEWQMIRCNEASKRRDSRLTWFNCKHARTGCWNIAKKKCRHVYELESLMGSTYIQYIYIHGRSTIWTIDVPPSPSPPGWPAQPRTISVFNYEVLILRFDHSIWIEERFCAIWSRCCNTNNKHIEGRMWRNHLQRSRS